MKTPEKPPTSTPNNSNASELLANERSKDSPLLSAPVPDPNWFVSITDEEVLQRIRHHHVHNYDKWRRMSTGAASTLISYQSGVLDLELRIPRPSLSNKEKLIFGVPRSWLNEPELQQAYGYILRVYETHHCDILLEIVPGRFQGEEGK